MRGVIETIKKELKLKNTALNAAKQFMEQTQSDMSFDENTIQHNNLQLLAWL
jgi:hypothetical protein